MSKTGKGDSRGISISLKPWEWVGLDSKIGQSARVSRGLQTPSERVSCSERVCNPRLTKRSLRLWGSGATREIMTEIIIKPEWV